MPLVSVIIPAYNAGKTIKASLESVLNQSMQDFEIIVIDDGSQDSTLEILSQIVDPRLKVFSYANAGVCISRNRGIEKAQGDFIAFLDADDLWLPNKLESHLEALADNPNATVAYCWVDFISQDGEFIRHGSRKKASGKIDLDLLEYNFLDCGSNCLIRRSAFKTVKGFNPSISMSEDWDFYLRLSSEYEFVLVPCTQVFYRISAHTASANVEKMEIESLYILNQAYKRSLGTCRDISLLKKTGQAHLYCYLLFKVFENENIAKRFLKGLKYLTLFILNDSTNTRPLFHKISMTIKVFLLFIFPEKRIAVRH